MSNDRRPSSLDGIKRLAKAIKAEQGLTHTEALNVAAKLAGYQGYTHARRQLESQALASGAAFPERPSGGSNYDHDAFLDRCRDAWIQTLDQLNPDRQNRRIWTGNAAIRGVLEPVLGHTRSHAHLPTGGGLDFLTARASKEPGVLEFQVERSSIHLARPNSLTLEWVARRPTESFLLLELASLAPSGAYEPDEEADSDPSRDWLRRREEVVELSPAEYVERYVWDQGHLGYNERGQEIPLPDKARLVTRWFNGKMLFVTKGSMWNGTASTYDGRHDSMSADQIRAMIERSLPKVLAAE